MPACSRAATLPRGGRPLSAPRFTRRQLLGLAGVGLLASGEVTRRVLTDEDVWERVRRRFSISRDHVQLAGLLLASHPDTVADAIRELRRGLDVDPVPTLRRTRRRHERRVRAAAARYLGVGGDDVAFTDSTTMGLGLTYNGLDLGPGDDVLTSEHDHYATHHSLDLKAARCGASVRRIALYEDPARAGAEEMARRVREALQPGTRAVALTWVHSGTGVKIPVRAIADAIAQANADRPPEQHVLLAIDGVHGLGVEDAGPIDLGCDVFVAGTHKWLLGPRGTGLVWAHPRAQDRIGPTIPTFTPGPQWGHRMTPGGFHSFEHRWALEHAFELHLALGRDRVQARIHALARRLKQGLARIEGVTLHTPLDPDVSSGIVCFDVAGRSPRSTVARLRRLGVIGSTSPYDPPHARFSPGLMNSMSDIDRAVEAVRTVV